MSRVYVKAGTVRVPDRWDGEAHATLQMVASPQAVLSRIQTNPNGRLVGVYVSVPSEGDYISVKLDDFTAKAPLPDGTQRVRLIFLMRASSLYGSFTVIVDFLAGSVDIYGKLEAVSDLTDWLHVPFQSFRRVRYS